MSTDKISNEVWIFSLVPTNDEHGEIDCSKIQPIFREDIFRHGMRSAGGVREWALSRGIRKMLNITERASG